MQAKRAQQHDTLGRNMPEHDMGAHGDIASCLVRGERMLAVVGLGYVGLPLAVAFGKHYRVLGFDINEERLAGLRAGIDVSGEVPAEALAGSGVQFTDSVARLREAHFFVVAVPTPIDSYNVPDLGALLAATRTVGHCLKRGDYVCYESTVYPGCTRGECIPVLEAVSGLRAGVDFKVGYSPERINPGDKEHRLENTVKVVSGMDGESLDSVARVYSTIVEVGVHRAPSLEVAEACKIVENTQRDVNIALMNELSILFGRLKINTFDVLEAAGTKWNFQKYYPGLVGGHCIGVDPYYLVYRASQVKYHTQMVSSGRFVNDSMGGYIGKHVVKRMIALGKPVRKARVLVMGITFKENVSDIRNSKAVDIVRELQDFGVVVEVCDPRARVDEVCAEYGFSLVEEPKGPYGAVVVAVLHSAWEDWQEADFEALTGEGGLLVDVRGAFRNRIHRLDYWSL